MSGQITDDSEPLKRAFEEFLNVPFPRMRSRNRRVSDLHGELVIYDAYVAGLVSSFIKSGAKLELMMAQPDERLETALVKLARTSRGEVAEDARALLDRLDEVHRLLEHARS